MQKKIIVVASCIISIMATIYFLGYLTLNWYFNRDFYYTPNLVGLTPEEVSVLADKDIIDIKVVGKDFSRLPEGQIFMQDPVERHIIKKGRTIKVWVSMGENYFEVPDFEGQQLFTVKKLLEEKRIKINSIARTDSPLSYNCIVATNPGKGEYVNVKDGISLLVSSRSLNKVVKVPDISGYTLIEAEKLLKENSIFIGKIEKIKVEGLEPNIVVDTSIGANSRISAGSTINITVTE
ncbi:PASTA domain-containing protein [Fusobacterium perfoetens]|uniref:PASTA domain-containing protein n=1 Tax=Fusobacterium perfoetens TaxID=852 RepID=UPI0026EEC431|nr:PASTA domain-containing protein [Fusobacterium perfoetens]